MFLRPPVRANAPRKRSLRSSARRTAWAALASLVVLSQSALARTDGSEALPRKLARYDEAQSLELANALAGVGLAGVRGERGEVDFQIRTGPLSCAYEREAEDGLAPAVACTSVQGPFGAFDYSRPLPAIERLLAVEGPERASALAEANARQRRLVEALKGSPDFTEDVAAGKGFSTVYSIVCDRVGAREGRPRPRCAADVPAD